MSLLPWSRITGVRCTGPAAPKPSTGTPSDASWITGNPAGNVVPTVAAVAVAAVAAASTAASAPTSVLRQPFFILCLPTVVET